MPTSAGILVYRVLSSGVEFFLGHPGGPLWRRRDEGAWSVPKGLIEPGEAPLDAAIREFHEETGLVARGDFEALAPIRQTGGKQVLCWSLEADLDLDAFRPGEFEMIWPPRSGLKARFPEIDRIAYFPAPEALTRILPSQAPLLHQVLNGIRV